MAVTLTSPVTGSAQTGLTSPTYSIALDMNPAPHAKQWYVFGLGGTQTGVTAQSVSSPFTMSFWRPPVFKYLPTVNPVTGQLPRDIPKNVYKVVTRKGVICLAGQPPQPMVITTILEIPAGADIADPTNVAAGQSLHLGALAQVSVGLGETTRNGVL